MSSFGLVVDGDPRRDVRILQDKGRPRAIMQDGKFFKNLLDGPAAS